MEVPRILHQGLSVKVAPTLLPFEGEGLFSKQSIHLLLYNNRGKKKRWDVAGLVIRDYLGTRVQLSNFLCQPCKSAYVCELEPGCNVDDQDPTT